jgi:S1-C subfamily serine protease
MNKFTSISFTIIVIMTLILIIPKNYFLYKDNNQTEVLQKEVDDLKSKLDNTQQKIIESSTESSSTTPTPNLSSIVSEWRKSTAYIVCYWNYSDGTEYKAQSGSALSATIGSVPTLITNKHVVFDPVSGYYANECDIKFPDDKGSYFYSKNTPNPSGTSYIPDMGNIKIDSNGNDVAYITEIGQSYSTLDTNDLKPATISFNERAIKNGHLFCKDKLNIGDSVVMLGYPSYGTKMSSVSISSAEPTATQGIISGVDGIFYTTSAKIEHGNSGGLAIDEKNNCYFGIPTWNESGSFESLGRILPTSTFLYPN